MARKIYKGKIDKDYILSLDKFIVDNECWKYKYASAYDRHTQVMINGCRYVLSRLVMCLWNSIDYMNYKIVARHKCSNEFCFNPEHIEPGSDSDNAKDRIRDGTDVNARKEVCPRCGGPFRNVIRKRDRYGMKKRSVERRCFSCAEEQRRTRRAKGKRN